MLWGTGERARGGIGDTSEWADAEAIVHRVNGWDAVCDERDAALAEVERLTEELAHAMTTLSEAVPAAFERDHHRETLRKMRGRQGCDACARRDLVLREREPQLFDEGSE
jgi:hypothetical protein